MLGASVVQVKTMLGGKSLTDMLIELHFNNEEILTRSELTPNMLTEDEISMLECARDAYIQLLDKLGGECDVG